MDDLLKEAIADAKAVRETALENAKLALEEAFTPKLQNMLSKKIQTEMEDEDEMKEGEHEDEMEERAHDDEMEERAHKMARDGDELDEKEDEDMEERKMMSAGEEDEMDESNVIEIDGVKYAPVVSEEDEEEMEEGAHEEDEEMDENQDLDLEAVIKELEAEINEEEEEEMDETVDENDVSSGIGKSDNAVDKKANDSSGIGSDGKAKLKEEKEDEMDEDVDLEEVLKALSEEEDKEEEMDEVTKLQSDLKEHRSVIEDLREKLNEVNLLNAKLLFTNKLFRKYGLNNEQKMKVVEQFDRASNLREVKLVYSTLGESFGSRKNEINESKGAASKPVASTKSEKEVITESSDLRDRFKKLANIL